MRRATFWGRLGLLVMGTAALPSLLGCLDHPLKNVEYDGASEDKVTVAISTNKDVDILFVIDNSGSMGEEQATLARNFGTFIDVLEAENVEANYRIGVTTTDNGNPNCSGGQGGALRLSSCRGRTEEFVFTGSPPADATQEACLDICNHDSIVTLPTTIDGDPTSTPRPWLERIEGVSNVAEGISTVEAFQCLGPQGISGCGFESPLESMYKSLRRAQDQNEAAYGFLRPDSILAVVFVTDEADCSAKSSGNGIFEADGGKAFWTNPEDGQPTSAVCWNAGVVCDGSSPYADCMSENFGLDGTQGVSDDDAVLHPVSRYIDFVQSLEDQRADGEFDREILVSVIGGVPGDYDAGQVEITYQDSADPIFQRDFGIGVGCQSAAGTAVPPVRLREFAEAFNVPLIENADSRNLFSVCASDYSGPLRRIARDITEQFEPACMPTCVRDTDPTTPALDASCTLTRSGGGEPDFDIPACLADGAIPDGTDVCFATLSAEARHPDCVAKEKTNVEFDLRRRPGTRDPGGSVVSATCEVSRNPAVDCPLPSP